MYRSQRRSGDQRKKQSSPSPQTPQSSRPKQKQSPQKTTTRATSPSCPGGGSGGNNNNAITSRLFFFCVPVVMRWMDIIFVMIVVIVVWKIATREFSSLSNNSMHNPSHFLLIQQQELIVDSPSASRSQQQQQQHGNAGGSANGNIISAHGSAIFRGTHACDAKYHSWINKKPVVVSAEEADLSLLSSKSTATVCQVYFPLEITTSTAITAETANIAPCSEEFCVRTLLQGCEEETRAESALPSKTNLCANQPPPKKRNHAALLRPLAFDGIEKQLRGNRDSPHNNNNNQHHQNIGQMIVLSDGINELGNMLAEEVVMQLPGLVLDPFRRYAKAYTKIKTKILTHAFESMDRKLYEEHRGLWNNAGASTLVILQYQSTVFLASAGNSVGFLAHWDEQLGHAEIIQSAFANRPDSPLEFQRIQESAGGVVKDDLDQNTGENQPMVFLKHDISAGGIPTSRVIGCGRWKLRNAGITAAPFITDEVDLTEWRNKRVAQNQGNDKTNSNQAQHPPQSSSTTTTTDSSFLFMVAASNQMLRFLSEQTLADKIGEALFSSYIVSLDDQIKDILQEASEKWPRTTIMAMDHDVRRDEGGAVYLDQLTLVATKVIAFGETTSGK
ncbi:hypothetical protein ACA910_007880 [Epithemia clementina (nom. ined.)]